MTEPQESWKPAEIRFPRAMLEEVKDGKTIEVRFDGGGKRRGAGGKEGKLIVITEGVEKVEGKATRDVGRDNQ